MKKFLIFTGLMLSLSLLAEAQQEVTVVLKDGKILKGKTIESLFEGFYTLEISSLKRENIDVSKVRGIYFGNYVSPERKHAYYQKNHGFFNHTEIHLLRGQRLAGDHYSNISLQTVNGYALSRFLMPGLGVGVDSYGDITISPVFASIRGQLMKSRLTPYYYAGAGWGLMWNPDESSGVFYEKAQAGHMLQAGLGLQFNLRESALTLGFGYREQKTELEYNYASWEPWRSSMGTSNINVVEERLMRRFSINFGFTF
ncbi:MAG: hypothetical protein ACLFUB_06620 [Cyclobacteriaceae bacterium]